MLRFKFLIALVVLFLANATNAQTVNSYEFDDSTCGAWSKSEGNPLLRSKYFSWFRGFVTGYNYSSYHNQNNQVRLERLSDETLHLYVNKYCQENPLAHFTYAATKLVKELTAKSASKN
jgi:hypothetical protein